MCCPCHADVRCSLLALLARSAGGVTSLLALLARAAVGGDVATPGTDGTDEKALLEAAWSSLARISGSHAVSAPSSRAASVRARACSRAVGARTTATEQDKQVRRRERTARGQKECRVRDTYAQ